MKSNMRKATAIILLLFVGIAAVFGGWALAMDPTGRLLGAEVAWLQYSPFQDYFIPGMILYTILGLGNIAVAFIVLANSRWYPYFVIAAGSAIVIWIVTQVFMVLMFHFMQLVIIAPGIALIALGLIERRRMNVRSWEQQEPIKIA